jgi:hypothetical protein
MTEFTRHELTQEHQKGFILGGKAIFTIESRKTGKHFTFSVNFKKATDRFPRDKYLVALLNGPDNTSNFTYVGELNTSTGEVRLTAGSRVARDASSYVALTWVLRRVWANQDLPDCEIWHEGRCCVCGRRLTVPESIENGIGPVCLGKS